VLTAATTICGLSERPQDVVAAGYDAMAARYAEWAARVVGDPRGRYVRQLLALMPERPDILEVGCGAAVEPTPTLAAAGRFVGVDISFAQLERARERLPTSRFVHGDLTTTSFEPASFDAVVALFVLTHVPSEQLPGLIRRIEHWLRAGGAFLGTFGTGCRHDTVVDDWLGVPMFFSGYDELDNERLVRHAGLEIIESMIEPMLEPETEPGRGSRTVAFHWILARKSRAA